VWRSGLTPRVIVNVANLTYSSTMSKAGSTPPASASPPDAGDETFDRRSGRFPVLRDASTARPRWTPPMRLTPMSIRRTAALLEPRLGRVPDVTDTIIVASGAADFVPADFVHTSAAQILVLDFASSSEQGLRTSETIRSIAAIIVDTVAAARSPEGLLARIRAERPEAPVMVLAPNVDHVAASSMARRGFVCTAGNLPPFELARRGAAFVDEALLRADLDRRLLDARSLEWGLTSREAELVWLCSMILPRARVERLMGCGHTTFESHLHRARTKMGAGTFHEVGRLART